MKLSGEIALASGFIFDYSNMINTDTITPAVIETLESKAKDAADAFKRRNNRMTYSLL